MLKYVNKVFGAPKNFFYGIGVAPYINLGSKQNTANLTKDQVLPPCRPASPAWRTARPCPRPRARRRPTG